MPNALTGEFDAVAQVRLEAVNRILAALHQAGGDPDASPSFPHSFAMRVGTLRLSELAIFAAGIQALGRTSGRRESPPPPPSSSSGKGKPLPGASQEAAGAAESYAEAQAALTVTAPVRGTAWVQASAPVVSLPSGLLSTVTAEIDVRAHYEPDPETRTLPSPIHGRVRADFLVEPAGWEGDKRLLEVKPTADDKRIQFDAAPGAGLEAVEGTIAGEIRRALRGDFEPMNVELPAGVKFSRFKGLGKGTDSTLVLPVTLSGPEPPDSALDALGEIVLNQGDHFAVAVSREHVDALLAPLRNSIEDFSLTISVGFWVVVVLVPVKVTVSYKVKVTGVSIDWGSGHITLTVQGQATTSSVFPNYSFTLQQKLTLALNAATQQVSLQPVGPLSISGPPGFMIDKVRPQAEAARDQAIAAAQGTVQQALTGEMSINDALHAFSSGVHAKYTAIDIQPAGAVLRGTMTVPARQPAVAEFHKRPGGAGVTALHSWVPAGRITRHQWSWERWNPYFDVPGHHVEGAKLAEIVDDPHGFLLPKPDEVPPDGRICLTVEGAQDPAGPGPSGSVWAQTCRVVWPRLLAFAPDTWAVAMAAPVWQTEPPRDGALEQAIAGHVSAFEAAAGRSDGMPAVVQFVEEDARQLLEAIGDAVRKCRGREPVTVVVVFPRGAFRATRAAFAARLGSLGREFRGSIILTEDYDMAWTRAFAVDRAPATFLIDASGGVAWQSVGPPDVAALARTLDGQVGRGTGPAPQGAVPRRLAVATGDRAPDVLFTDQHRRSFALRKLRGRRVHLFFWRSWSTPCLAELARLERAYAAGQAGGMVVAIGDGEGPERVAELWREHGLSLPVSADPTRAIARQYGVTAWPTSVWVGARGLVEGSTFGAVRPPAAHGERRARGADVGERTAWSPLGP